MQQILRTYCVPYHVLGPGDMAVIHRNITLALIDLTVDKEQNRPPQGVSTRSKKPTFTCGFSCSQGPKIPGRTFTSQAALKNLDRKRGPRKRTITRDNHKQCGLGVVSCGEHSTVCLFNFLSVSHCLCMP